LQASVQDTENRIAKKIHDELANDVFQTMTFAETHDLDNPEKKELLVENLESIYEKARDISRNNSAIPTDEKFEHALWDLINSFNSESVNVIVKNSPPVDWHKISSPTKNAIYRVLQELMVNMKKHSEAELVVLVFSSTAKAITIKYSDNGKGLDTLAFDKKGLQNAENRILALKGSLTFENEIHKGFKVSIQIPK
jgi:signal transduction histidine kinase